MQSEIHKISEIKSRLFFFNAIRGTNLQPWGIFSESTKSVIEIENNILVGKTIKFKEEENDFFSDNPKVFFEDFNKIKKREIIAFHIDRASVIMEKTKSSINDDKYLYNMELGPEVYYVQSVNSLPSVRAITLEKSDNTVILAAILEGRNLETREAIYEIESKMFSIYGDIQFSFYTTYFVNFIELSKLLENKEILFYSSL